MKNQKRIIAIIILLLAAACILGAWYIGSPKDQVSGGQVMALLESHSYTPNDATQSQKEKYPDMGYVSCVVAEKDDLHLEFFEFEDTAQSISVYKDANIHIRGTHQGLDPKEKELHFTNYRIYTSKCSTEYAVALYVGSTALYAYCAPENADSINTLLSEINYLEHRPGFRSGRPFALSELMPIDWTISRLGLFVILDIALVLLNIFCCNWVMDWMEQSVNATKKEMHEYTSSIAVSGKHRSRRIYYWMLERAPDKEEFRRRYRLANTAMVPGFVGGFAMLSLAISGVKQIPEILLGLIAVYCVVMFLAGRVYRNRRSDNEEVCKN